MNAIVKQEFGVPSAVFAKLPAENDLGAGVSGGYGHIGYKGKVWSIRHKGSEQMLMREDGDGPRGSIEVVIVSASKAISKAWYEAGFVEGTKAPPDCFSHSGVTPEPSSVKKQNSVCATCPRNAFGSAVKQDGTPGKGKACSDSRRMAVVPMNDIDNDLLGGPLLLKVPAASLNDVATYGAAVQKMGFPYYGVATRIGFDATDAYPKFTLSPIRALTDEEASKVMALRGDARVDRILAEDVFDAPIAEDVKPALAFEQPTGAPAAGTPTPGVVTSAPVIVASPKATKPKPATAPVAAAGGFGAAKPAAIGEAPAPVDAAAAKAFDDNLDEELEKLIGAPAPAAV